MYGRNKHLGVGGGGPLHPNKLAARNGMFVAVLFGVLLGTIVFIAMMIGSMSNNGGGVHGGGGGGSHRHDTEDPNDDTVNPLTGNALYSGHESPALCVGKLRFPRQHIQGPCEGYFAVSINASSGANEGDALPFPVTHRFQGCGMVEWARRLHVIERVAGHEETMDVPSSGIHVQRQRGLTTSRITSKLLGNKEFIDFLGLTNKYMEDHPNTMAENGGPGKLFALTVPSSGSAQVGAASTAAAEAETSRRRLKLNLRQGDVVCWTGDLREHYVSDYNTMPSQEFYQYVLDKYTQLVEVQR